MNIIPETSAPLDEPIKGDIPTGTPIIPQETTTDVCTCTEQKKGFKWLLFLIGGYAIARVTQKDKTSK